MPRRINVDPLFLEDEDAYREMIERLQNVRYIHLTTGNCGVYAQALMELTKVGKVVVLSDIDNRRDLDFSHCMLEVSTRYYDGIGIYTFEEALSWHDNEFSMRYLEDDCDSYKQSVEQMIDGTNDSGFHNVPVMRRAILKYIPEVYKLR